MIVPAVRLLWLAALVCLPAAAAAGLFPALAGLGSWALALCAAAALADAIAGARRIDMLEVRTPASVRLTKDTPAVIPLAIENRMRRPASIRIGVRMPDGIDAAETVRKIVAPAGHSTVDWTCTGVQRGDHLLGEVHLETPSPMGFWMIRHRYAAECKLRVYPSLRDRETAELFQRTSTAGMRMRRQIGKGREFDNLRQYAFGDGIEDVHWKATARRGYPVVKQYRVEHAQEVYAVVDASRLSAREGILEGYINAALHLALVAERQGDRFGLVTFSDRTHTLVRARSGVQHFRHCREAIYNLQARRVSPDFGELFSSLQLHLRRRSLLVLFTSLDDALLAETFEREVGIIARRHLVLVNVTQTRGMQPLFTGEPPEDLAAVYAGLAGQMQWNRMRRLALALGNRGVKLTVLEPDRIKTQVAAGYLEVKRRQAL
jgi:uncharacterized protein (DUF58 family)